MLTSSCRYAVRDCRHWCVVNGYPAACLVLYHTAVGQLSIIYAAISYLLGIVQSCTFAIGFQLPAIMCW